MNLRELRIKRLCFILWLHLNALHFILTGKGFFLVVSVFMVCGKKDFVQPLYFLRNCDLKHTVIKTSKNITMLDHLLSGTSCFIVLFCVGSIFWKEKILCTNFVLQIPLGNIQRLKSLHHDRLSLLDDLGGPSMRNHIHARSSRECIYNIAYIIWDWETWLRA